MHQDRKTSTPLTDEHKKDLNSKLSLKKKDYRGKMQQEMGGSEERKPMSQQDRRLKPMQGGENQQQLQQPQKCPRCESLNTKFCYYNNYSLSQPRYFCKTCRRYWTQGGTLRNVPVGGGCRKGKRSKTSTSAENSRSSQSLQPPPPPQQVQQNLTTPQNIISSNPLVTRGPVLRTKEPGNLATPSSIPSMASYYPTGGFLSSLAAIQSLNQQQSFNQPLNQVLNIDRGDHIGASSNLGLLQGYSVPSFGSPQYYQMGNREKSVNPIYHPSEESLIHSTRPGSSAQHDWHQGFINNTNPSSSDTALWSISTSSGANTNCNTNTGPVVSGSLNPNQWPYLPGYGPPP